MRENFKVTILISTILSRQTKEQDCVWIVGRWLLVLYRLHYSPKASHILSPFFCCRIKSAAGELCLAPNLATCDIGSHFPTPISSARRRELGCEMLFCLCGTSASAVCTLARRLKCMCFCRCTHRSSYCSIWVVFFFFSCSFVAVSFPPWFVTHKLLS